MIKIFFKYIKAKLSGNAFYIEIEKAGGLNNALNLELINQKSYLKIQDDEVLKPIPFAFARIENKNKFSQVSIAKKEKLYLVDFWKDGVCLTHGKTNNILELVKTINFWLTEDVTIKVLSDKFHFVETSERAKIYEENKEVEFKWNTLIEDNGNTKLDEFAKLAMKDEIIGKLFPYTSLYTLCFSRCTGFPFSSDDLPNVTPEEVSNFLFFNTNPVNKGKNINFESKDEKKFIVTKNKTEFIGSGNAMEALKLVKENLPTDVKPAIKGTADDI